MAFSKPATSAQLRTLALQARPCRGSLAIAEGNLGMLPGVKALTRRETASGRFRGRLNRIPRPAALDLADRIFEVREAEMSELPWRRAAAGGA